MNEQERRILEDYVASAGLMQLSTVDSEGAPQVCHVWYQPQFRPDLLRFVSRQDRAHSVNLRRDGRVAGGIITSPPEALGQVARGVSFQGHAVELPARGIDAVVDAFLDRWPAARRAITVEKLAAGTTVSRMYEIRVTSWVLYDEKVFRGHPRHAIPAS